MRVERAPVATRARQRRYGSTQIRAVLASRETVSVAARQAGVALQTAKQWRAGLLPQWFVDEQDAQAACRARAVAARFVNPRDARAGR